MKTGRIEANLVKLNEDARLSHVDELIARKLEERQPFSMTKTWNSTEVSTSDYKSIGKRLPQ